LITGFSKLENPSCFCILILNGAKNFKELNSWSKFLFFNSNIFPTWCCRLLIFQTINLVISKNLSLKYQRFTLAGYKDISFRKIELVTKTQFLSRLLIPDCDWLNFVNFSGFKYKIRLVSRLRKRENQALISITPILKFPALINLIFSKLQKSIQST